MFIYIFKMEFMKVKENFSGCVRRKKLSERLEPITDLCHLSSYFIGI